MYDIIESKKNDIYNIIKNVMTITFIKLKNTDLQILIKYLYKTTMLFGLFIENEHFIEQITMNNNQDIFSFLVLLMPFYNLHTSKNLTSFDELFLNENESSINFDSSYYIDHEDIIVEDYFKNSFLSIYNTLKSVSNNILPNWINIFPYTTEKIKENRICENLGDFLKHGKFQLDTIFFDIHTNNTSFFTNTDYVKNKRLKLGYDNLVGTINNFLYDDIKTIKWMIYDVKYVDNYWYPNIIILCELLEIHSFETLYDKLSENEKNKIRNKWLSIVDISNVKQNYDYISNAVSFYCRWSNYSKINVDSKCINFLKKKEEKLKKNNNQYNEYDDVDNGDEIVDININDDKIKKCIILIAMNIDIEHFYDYIFNCFQQFKYTWYGYSCLNDDKTICVRETFKNIYVKKMTFEDIYKSSTPFKTKDGVDIYMTPKNVYNFAKSIVNYNNAENNNNTENNNNAENNNYIQLSSYSWNGLFEFEKQLLIDRLNKFKNYKDTDDKITDNWFNIPNNLKRMYQHSFNYDLKLGINTNDKFNKLIDEINVSMFYFMMRKNMFAQIICETLIYNGMLTYFVYNPDLTNESVVPNKNEWRKHVNSKVNINEHKNGYNFLNNKKIKYHDNYEKNVKNTRWYFNFGANWVAQIQIFHHYINQRVMFITGATGAGKSTVAPFMLLYATKIIKYKNNGKIFVTQPRIKPERGNAMRMAEQLGVPINKDLAINYFQYKDSEENVTDEFYHPCLRILTDGAFYNMMDGEYLFKIRTKDGNYTENNIFDMLLVDEAHEHNTYMDFILTLMRTPIYVNNQISFGIVSATMEKDELIYRKYYESIDDNWNYPLDFNYNNENYTNLDYDKNMLDRRIHLSVPFGQTNFKITEHTEFVRRSEIDIVKHILKTSVTGDILIFEPGENEIKKLVILINENTPKNVIAIPFYTNLNKTVKDEIINNIDKNDVRNNFYLPKNIDINNYYDISDDEKVKPYTYNRFIIVATNIAEASITFETLEYVIDTGTQKNSIYDVNYGQIKMSTSIIAISNQIQRKGRVGRVKAGHVYYTYNLKELSKSNSYKISMENIENHILSLISTTNKLFITIDFIDDIQTNEKLLFLKNQYYSFDTKYDKYEKKSIEIIYFPFDDGKYDAGTLIDEDGTFYIIHPNQNDFERDKDLKIIKTKNTYSNTVKKIITHYVHMNIVNDYILTGNNYLTPYGILMSQIKQYLVIENNQIAMLILSILSFNYNFNVLNNVDNDINNKDFNLIKDLVVFICFCLAENSSDISINIPLTFKTKADFLLKAKIIQPVFFNKLTAIDVVNYLNKNTITNKYTKYSDEIQNFIDINVNNIFTEYTNYNAQKIEKLFKKKDALTALSSIKFILQKYYELSIKLQFLNTNITINNKSMLSLYENEKNTKINLSNIPVINNALINNVKQLNQYEQMCYFIVKNFKNNLLIKIPHYQSLYTRYYYRNLDLIYNIAYTVKNNKKILNTNLQDGYLNYLIFHMNFSRAQNEEDGESIENLIFINTTSIKYINYLIIYEKNMPKNFIDVIGRYEKITK